MNAKWPMLFLILALVLMLCPAKSAHITVGSDGANFKSIQDAVNSSGEGDTIVVQSGVYLENVLVDHRVALHGVGNPVIDAQGRGTPIKLGNSGIIMEGFTIINSGGSDPGVDITGSVFDFRPISNTTIQRNVIANNSAGVLVSDSEYNVIKNNIIKNNRQSGIDLAGAGKNAISNNTVELNRRGISLTASSDNEIRNNSIQGNDEEGILLSNRYLSEVGPSGFSDHNALLDNEIRNNENGISLNYAENNIIYHNKLINNRCGILLKTSENNSILDNAFTDNYENISSVGGSRDDARAGAGLANYLIGEIFNIFLLLIILTYISILMCLGLITGFIVRKALKRGSLSVAASSALGAIGSLFGYLLLSYLFPSYDDAVYIVSIILAAVLVAAANLLMETGAGKNSGKGPGI